MADATAFINADLDRNAFLQALHMADHANGLAAGVERIECCERDFQRLAVECAEAFVEEERVDRGLVTDQIGEGEGQREADEKALAAGEGPGIAADVALPGVDNFQFQFAHRLAAQGIAGMEPQQVAVGEAQQVIEGEALGELPVFVAARGADQPIEALPEIAVGGFF